ncbi:MAG: WecB/TagA/CpsF family glycosyltransferase [Planctomycetota bacterium]
MAGRVHAGRAEGLDRRARILGIRIHNLTMEESLQAILSRLDRPGAGQVSFVNAHCANLAWKDPEYRRILDTSDLVFADGIGMQVAGRILGCPIRDNVNGTDLFPRLCAILEGTGKRVFLLGGRDGVAAGVRGWIARHHPGTVVCGIQNGFFSLAEEDQIVARIRDARADVLLVALGVPAQEKWIARVQADTTARLAFGVGGLFDFYSGRIPRAPGWMQRSGVEWVWRLAQEPGRMWKRYLLGNFTFLFCVLRERFRGLPAARFQEDR